MEQIELKGNSVLRADRSEIEFVTEDGHTLVGELALPRSGRVAATIIALHPLPTAEGNMDSHILRKAAWRLPELADVAVLRFNTRGTTSLRGTSEGSFGEGIDEAHDVLAALAWAVSQQLPNIWLLGWSFGTELALKHGQLDQVEGVILLSPPLHRTSAAELSQWSADSRPMMALVPEHDDYLKPEEAKQRFASIPHLRVIGVAGARHLWVGEKYSRIVLDHIVAHIAPTRHPLPTTVSAAQLVTEKH